MDRSPGRFTRAALIAAVIAMIAVGSGALGLALRRDDGDGASSTTTTTPDDTTTTEVATLDELSGPARDLAELLAAGRTRTYHARYQGSTVGQDDGAIVIESWAKDGRFRQDVGFDVGGVAVQRSTFVLDERGVSCQRSGEEPWSCTDLPRSEVQGADPLTGSALAQLKHAAVGEQEGAVDGRPARCFIVTYDAQTTEMCVSPDGIPLQIRTTESQLVVDLLEDVVDEAAFEPPA